MRNRLAALPPLPWEDIESWAAGALPFFRTSLPQHLDDFSAQTKMPSWVVLPVFGGGGGVFGEPAWDNSAEVSAAEAKTNHNIAERAQQKILSWLDGLITCYPEETPPTVTVETRTFPEDVRQYADLRFQVIADEARKRIDAERAKARQSGGPRTSPTAHIFEVVEDRKKLSAALVRARLETLVEALRRSGQSVRQYRDLITNEVSDAARTAAASTRSEIERLSTAAGGLPSMYGLLMDADRLASQVIADAGARLRLAELDDDYAQGAHTARSWRDGDPPGDCDLDVLAMKRVFDKDIVAASSESSAEEPLSMLFIDLDDLKQLNGRFTNPRVNRGLAALARTLVKVAKGRGKAYRYGGDEFALLLANVSGDEAARTAERIRAAVDTLAVPEEPEMHLSVSIGVACLEDVEDRNSEALEIAATKASIAAKAKGKNRVVTWPVLAD
jgi:diguanylate cyclase (GGDEF)-like protein